MDQQAAGMIGEKGYGDAQEILNFARHGIGGHAQRCAPIQGKYHTTEIWAVKHEIGAPCCQFGVQQTAAGPGSFLRRDLDDQVRGPALVSDAEGCIARRNGRVKLRRVNVCTD